MFPGLGHRSVCSRDHQDGAVHLSSSGNHVFNVVGMAWAVYVGVMPGAGFVLNVSGVNGNPALLLFRSFVDLVVSGGNRAADFGKHGGDSRSQSSLAMVNVTDSPDVDVRFVTFKFLFAHFFVFIPF